MQKTAILYDASQAILSTFDLDEVLNQILSIVRDYFRVNRAAVLLINPETKEFSLRSQIGGFQTDLSMATGNGIIGQAARRKRPLYVADVSINPHYVANFADTNSELAIPLMVRDQVVGVLDIQSDQLDYFNTQMPPVYDQGQLGSCTANSIGAILEFNELKQGETDAAPPSRLFIYYNERAMEGTISQDSGAEIRDGIKSVAQLGAPPETSWPYVITKFARKPPAKAYRDARKHQAIRYARVVQSEMGIQNVLAAGYPISFGFTVYESFE